MCRSPHFDPWFVGGSTVVGGCEHYDVGRLVASIIGRGFLAMFPDASSTAGTYQVFAGVVVRRLSCPLTVETELFWVLSYVFCPETTCFSGQFFVRQHSEQQHTSSYCTGSFELVHDHRTSCTEVSRRSRVFGGWLFRGEICWHPCPLAARRVYRSALEGGEGEQTHIEADNVAYVDKCVRRGRESSSS